MADPKRASKVAAEWIILGRARWCQWCPPTMNPDAPCPHELAADVERDGTISLVVSEWDGPVGPGIEVEVERWSMAPE